MRRERVAPQSEVIRVIVLEDSPYCVGGPHRDVLDHAGRIDRLVLEGLHDVQEVVVHLPAIKHVLSVSLAVGVCSTCG